MRFRRFWQKEPGESMPMMIDPEAKLLVVLDNAEEYRDDLMQGLVSAAPRLDFDADA
jgi:hypothetical protein